MLPALMAALTLAAADPSSAPAAPATPVAAAPEKPKPKDTDTVCWTEQVTGSHYPRRVCSTRLELEQRQRQDQAAIGQHGRTMSTGAFGKGN